MSVLSFPISRDSLELSAWNKTSQWLKCQITSHPISEQSSGRNYQLLFFQFEKLSPEITSYHIGENKQALKKKNYIQVLFCPFTDNRSMALRVNHIIHDLRLSKLQRPDWNPRLFYLKIRFLNH